MVWGGVEEQVTVVSGGQRHRTDGTRGGFRLALADGTVLDVSHDEPDGQWRIDREMTD